MICGRCIFPTDGGLSISYLEIKIREEKTDFESLSYGNVFSMACRLGYRLIVDV